MKEYGDTLKYIEKTLESVPGLKAAKNGKLQI